MASHNCWHNYANIFLLLWLHFKGGRRMEELMRTKQKPRAPIVMDRGALLWSPARHRIHTCKIVRPARTTRTFDSRDRRRCTVFACTDQPFWDRTWPCPCAWTCWSTPFCSPLPFHTNSALHTPRGSSSRASLPWSSCFLFGKPWSRGDWVAMIQIERRVV